MFGEWVPVQFLHFYQLVAQPNIQQLTNLADIEGSPSSPTVCLLVPPIALVQLPLYAWGAHRMLKKLRYCELNMIAAAASKLIPCH
jgi:hypothetical protein